MAFRSVHIVPTYACNLACAYCYASKYKGNYTNLTWKKYLRILNLLVTNNVQEIRLIGGEPTIWPHIDRAIETAQGLGMRVSLLTNGVKRTQAVPHAITVNGNNLTDAKLRKKIIMNIKWYRAKGTAVGLRFNLNPTDSEKKIERYIRWAREYAHGVSFTPTVPYPLEKKIGTMVYHFARLLQKTKIPATLNRALPLCIFTTRQRDFLKKYAKLYSKCMPAVNEFTINPDLSILPCVDLNLPRRLSRDFKKISQDYQKEITALQKKPLWKKCQNCKFFPRDCQGACLTMKCSLPHPSVN